MRPMPPTSAAQVIKVLTREAASVSSPSLSPSRWRIKLNTGCLATAATRPLISEKTMIPTVEKANTQTSAKPNVEPAFAANTSSLMSTNPPTAVMIPSVSSSGFKLVLDLLQPFRALAQLLWWRVVGLGHQVLHDGAGRRLRQYLRDGRQLIAEGRPH